MGAESAELKHERAIKWLAFGGAFFTVAVIFGPLIAATVIAPQVTLRLDQWQCVENVGPECTVFRRIS